jgi:hypothetical protein
VGGTALSGVGELHRLYIDGLKLSPPRPTMLDLRDAMLQADALRNPGGAGAPSLNYCRLWEEFAGRGMGTDARDTKDTGTNLVLAGFGVAPGCASTPRPLRSPRPAPPRPRPDLLPASSP